MQYVFRDDFITIKNAKKADPQKIGDALTKVATAAGGNLTPKAVVDFARARNSTLHPFFEWDNDLAAECHRLDQARNLIRSIKIVDDDRPSPSPAFISIAEKGGVAYRPLQEVLNSSSLQLVALQAAERDLRSVERRYQSMADICAVVREAREKLGERRANIESRGQAAA